MGNIIQIFKQTSCVSEIPNNLSSIKLCNKQTFIVRPISLQIRQSHSRIGICGGVFMPKQDEIKVIVVNKPSKEESAKKLKELSEFLSKTWQIPLNKTKA